MNSVASNHLLLTTYKKADQLLIGFFVIYKNLNELDDEEDSVSIVAPFNIGKLCCIQEP